MPVGRMSIKAFDEMVASGAAVVDPGPKCPNRYERAFRSKQPHFAHPADITDLADELCDSWFARAVRFGDEVLFLSRLHNLEADRTAQA